MAPKPARISRSSWITRGILLGVLAVGILIVGLDAWRTYQARSVALAADATITANLARSLAQHAHDMFHTADVLLVGFRERFEVDGISAAAIARDGRLMQDRVSSAPLVAGLFAVSAEGAILARSQGVAAGDSGVGDAVLFKTHRDTPDRGLLIGEPMRDSDGRWVITLSRRLDARDGSFGGAVVVMLSLDALQRFYQTFDVGREGIISLASTKGVLVARTPPDDQAIGHDVSGSAAFRHAMATQVASFAYVASLDTISRLGSSHRVDDYTFYVVVAHGTDDVLADWWSDGVLHLFISLATAIALALAGQRFAHHLAGFQRAEDRYRLLADNSSDAILCIAETGEKLYISPAFTAITGWSVAEAMRRPFGELIHPDDRAAANAVRTSLRLGDGPGTLQFRYTCKDGAFVWVEARFQIAPSADGDHTLFIASIRDISKRKAAEEEIAALNRALAAQAYTDSLTGLDNRRRFDEQIKVEWRRATREQSSLSLLMIDVDRFKLYNDRFGHPQGDRCLQAVAGAIAGNARRPGDITARYGGEEIVVLAPITDAAGAATLAERVRHAIEATQLDHPGNPPSLVVTASIGVATTRPQRGDAGPDALLAAADAALYAAKHAGRNQVVSHEAVREAIV